MIELPEDTGAVPVLRVDFSDDAIWAQLRSDLLAADYAGSGYEPNLDFVERRELSGLDDTALQSRIPRSYPSAYDQPFLIVIDAAAVSSPEHAVLLIDLSEQHTAPSFRALPREIAAIEANLSLANMDFFEFGDNTGDDGIFRGFPPR